MTVYSKIALVILIFYLYFQYKIKTITTPVNIEIYNIIDSITHTIDNQQLISYDSDNYAQNFGEYSYITNIYNTSKYIIGITENIEKTNNNKYVLWLPGLGDVFCHPFVTKELIKKGYDIYAIDLPNIGFAQYNNKKYLNYPTVGEIIGYLNAAIQLIDSKYNNPQRVIYGISLGSVIALYYIKLYPTVFSKCVLNGPYIDRDLNDLDNYITDAKAFLYLLYNFNFKFKSGELSKLCLSMAMYDIRPYGISKNYINDIITYYSTNETIKNPQTIMRLENGHGRYLIKSNDYLIIKFFAYFFNYHNITTIYNIPTLILCSDISVHADNVCLDLNDKYFGLKKYGDLAVNINCIKNNCKDMFSNYKIVQLNEASHDVFYSEKEIRNQAIREFLNFLI